MGAGSSFEAVRPALVCLHGFAQRGESWRSSPPCSRSAGGGCRSGPDCADGRRGGSFRCGVRRRDDARPRCLPADGAPADPCRVLHGPYRARGGDPRPASAGWGGRSSCRSRPLSWKAPGSGPRTTGSARSCAAATKAGRRACGTRASRRSWTGWRRCRCSRPSARFPTMYAPRCVSGAWETIPPRSRSSCRDGASIIRRARRTRSPAWTGRARGVASAYLAGAIDRKYRAIAEEVRSVARDDGPGSFLRRSQHPPGGSGGLCPHADGLVRQRRAGGLTRRHRARAFRRALPACWR